MNSFGDSSAETHAQVRKYLGFFRQKKEGILRAINLAFEDAKADKLNEDMYTRDDVLDFADFLSSAIRTEVGADLSSVINMGALAVNQLLETAQNKGLELAIETAHLENQLLLEEVDKMSLDALPKNPKRGVALASFKDEAKQKVESGKLEDSNNRLKNEIKSLRSRLQAAEREAQLISESKNEDSSQLKELEQELDEAKEENNKRIAETTQFQQMKKLMQSQSVKIRDLRLRLQKYEPDNAKEEDF